MSHRDKGYNPSSKRLEITTTANQDPLLSHVPIIGVDIWEHAFYLQYLNVKADYLNAICQNFSMTVLAGDVGKLHLSIAALTFTVVSGLLYPWPGRRLNHIPAVGYKSQLLSFIGGFQWYYKAQKMVQEGCHRFGEGVFKVPNVMQWVVIVNGEKYIEEYRKAPENVLSFHDEVKEVRARLV
ncbi:hypothetical protein H0H87_009393 [Tephrocybe sp. NHM501043]|nr:hypothetical protein H0H87_009393 [Tephrocybe sp. NHM501043]